MASQGYDERTTNEPSKLVIKGSPTSGLPWVFLLFVNILLLCVLVSFSSAEQKNRETAKDQKVTLNFVEVDLPVVAKFVSDITGNNFIFDEKFKGKITIIAPSKLSTDEAFALFTSVLELKGFTLVPAGVSAYKIIPAVQAKQSGMKVSTETGPISDNYAGRLVALKYISAEQALKFLQPLGSKDGHISIFGPGNMFLVVDSGTNINKILSILELIDRPSVTEIPEVVFLKHASADAVMKALNEGLGKAKGATIPGQATMDTATAVADQRLNAVILFGDKGRRESMKGLISLIDEPSPESQGRINVYFLENADATELAKVLQGIISGTQSQRQPQTATAPVTPFEAAGGITITPDKASNALVSVASPSDYRNLLQVITKLDQKRRQVFVEALIVEASINKVKELGTKWRISATSNGQPVSIAGFGTIDSTSVQNIAQGLEGGSLGGLGKYMTVPVTTTDSNGNSSTTNLTVPGFAFLFNLKDFRDAVNVLSSPQILTSDNKEAEILVGENVPFVSQSQTTSAVSSSTSGTSSGIVNSIVRQDVGIILKITPQITEGDNVNLDIYQEISSVQNQSDQLTVSLGPTITKRSTKTSIVVKDGATVVIGGLMQETGEETRTTMPGFSEIPILGWLFRNKSVSKDKTNLLVFLTAHIIRDSGQLEQITNDKQKEFGIEELGKNGRSVLKNNDK